MKLDLGSGPRPAPGFEGVDKIPGITEHTVDFGKGEPWPFDDDSVDELRSCHCIEHLDGRDVPEWQRVTDALDEDGRIAFISQQSRFEVLQGNYGWRMTTRTKDLLFHFFDEAFRIIKPGGRFEVRCPPVSHDNASGDPTHRRFISRLLLQYLSREGREAAGVSFYNAECNWVGTVDEMMRFSEQPTEAELDAVRQRLGRERNVNEELFFHLRAEK